MFRHIQVFDTPPYSKETFRNEFLKTFVLLNLPFNVADHCQLKRLFHMCRQTVDMPSASMIKSDLNSIAEDMRNNILLDLRKVDKVSLALDAWTSPNKLAFLAVVLYYIDSNWKYRHILIGFEQLQGEHKGANFAEIVTRLASRYEITDKILAITTDNASNNGTMAKQLEEDISNLTETLSGSSEIFHVPCLAHVIQLSVKAFTDEIKATASNESVDKSITDDQIENAKKEKKGFYRTLSLVI